MTSYLVFAIVHCNVFERLPPGGNVDVDNDHVQFWYPMLWRHKAPYNFYQVQDKFVREFRHIMVGTQLLIITHEALNFLKGRNLCI
jgi:hypothetical protein